MVRFDFWFFGYRVLHCNISAERTQMMAALMHKGVSATTRDKLDVLIRERDYIENIGFISEQKCNVILQVL